MKRFFLFLSTAALFLGTLALTSCNKDKQEQPTVISLTAAEITASSAQINVTVTGAEPQMVRLMDPVTLESLGDFDVADLDKVEEYASKGHAIGLPYSSPVNDLAPATEYFTAAVASDANFKVVSVASTVFTTAVPDNAIGENNGAGEVKNERW